MGREGIALQVEVVVIGDLIEVVSSSKVQFSLGAINFDAHTGML